jgi:hypothetical protein
VDNQRPPVAAGPIAPVPTRLAQVTEIRVLQGESVRGVAVNDVQVGPSAAIQQASVWQLYPEVAERPSSISIAGGPGLIPRDEPYDAQ